MPPPFLGRFPLPLLIPGGAFVQMLNGTYSGVMTFVEHGQQIRAVGTAFFASVGRIRTAYGGNHAFYPGPRAGPPQ